MRGRLDSNPSVHFLHARTGGCQILDGVLHPPLRYASIQRNFAARDFHRHLAGVDVIRLHELVADLLAHALIGALITFQRILTYTLRSLTQKLSQMLLLVAGLVMTGHAILTPRLIAIIMITGDFLAMSATTDNVRPSPRPNAWHINNISVLGVSLAAGNLAFCAGIIALGRYRLGLSIPALQTLATVAVVFTGQAIFYVVRDRRRLWSSRPSRWIVLSSIADVAIITVLATQGFLMTPLPAILVAGVLGAAAGFAFVLDGIKLIVSRSLQMQ